MLFGSRPYHRLAVLAWNGALASVALSVLTGCTTGTFHNQFSTSQEIALGNQISGEVEKENKMDYSAQDNARVQRLAQPIFDQARKLRSNVVYQIHIISSPEVNAFSLPGGWIYVYTGLLDKIGADDDALACVIGHETSHVVFRHAVKQLSDEEGKGDLVMIAGILSNNYNVYNAASLVTELEDLHYSREDEYTADKYGLLFAYNAGFDPYGMPRFFDRLQQLEKNSDDPPAYAEDHPVTKNRILRANQLIEELITNHGQYPNDHPPF